MKNGDSVNSPIEYHFGIPWKIGFIKGNGRLYCSLECHVPTEFTNWSIETIYSGTLFKNLVKTEDGDKIAEFGQCPTSHIYFNLSEKKTSKRHLIDGKFPVEFKVQILKMSGELRRFNDNAAKKFSDVQLIVGDQKYHVQKQYLAVHCTYFASLFFGSFSESGKSVVKLKDIDPEHFQNFLELIYGYSELHDTCVLGILHLAHFFDSNTAIRRCDEYLQEKSGLPLKDKFEAAIKYKLDALKEKCLTEMKTLEDYFNVIPEDPSDFDSATWKELIAKAYNTNN